MGPLVTPANPWLSTLQGPLLPELVGFWPLAPGWWGLAAGVLLAALWGGWRRWRRWQADAYRRQALRELDALKPRLGLSEPASAPTEQRLAALRRLPALLRQVALQSAPRQTVAPLSGEAWWRWLDDRGDGQAFANGAGELLQRVAFASAAEVAALPAAELEGVWTRVTQWIRHHPAGEES